MVSETMDKKRLSIVEIPLSKERQGIYLYPQLQFDILQTITWTAYDLDNSALVHPVMTRLLVWKTNNVADAI